MTAPTSGNPAQTWLQRMAVAVLALVAAVGAALSYASLYEAAIPTFGRVLAAGFPLLVDALILGASTRYVAGAQVGRPRQGWRWTAHAGVAGTILLNALASPDLTHVPWHVTAPVVWSVLVELTAKDVLGEWRATHTPTERIPFRLWLTAPVESAATALRVARQHAHAGHRLGVGQHAAAVEAVRVATGGRLSARRVRRILRRQLRAGSLPHGAVLAAVGWVDGRTVEREPEAVLRLALSAVLAPAPPPGPASRGPVEAGQEPKKRPVRRPTGRAKQLPVRLTEAKIARLRRANHGVTQADVARSLGVSVRTVARYWPATEPTSSPDKTGGVAAGQTGV